MKFDMAMNLGNVLTIVGGIVAFITLWLRTSVRVENVEVEQKRQSETLSEIAKIGLLTTVAQHERRLLAMEDSIGDLHEMKNDIRWIKRSMNNAKNDHDETT
jgi:hypothetical protein